MEIFFNTAAFKFSSSELTLGLQVNEDMACVTGTYCVNYPNTQLNSNYIYENL